MRSSALKQSIALCGGEGRRAVKRLALGGERCSNYLSRGRGESDQLLIHGFAG